jgi:hypothetical protein
VAGLAIEIKETVDVSPLYAAKLPTVAGQVVAINVDAEKSPTEVK